MRPIAWVPMLLVGGSALSVARWDPGGPSAARTTGPLPWEVLIELSWQVESGQPGARASLGPLLSHYLCAGQVPDAVDVLESLAASLPIEVDSDELGSWLARLRPEGMTVFLEALGRCARLTEDAQPLVRVVRGLPRGVPNLLGEVGDTLLLYDGSGNTEAALSVFVPWLQSSDRVRMFVPAESVTKVQSWAAEWLTGPASRVVVWSVEAVPTTLGGALSSLLASESHSVVAWSLRQPPLPGRLEIF